MSIKIIKFFFLLFLLHFNPASATEDDDGEEEAAIPEIKIDLTNKKTETVEPQDSFLLQDQEINIPGFNQNEEQQAVKFLNEIVHPGELRELSWSAGQSFYGKAVKPPVLIIRGIKNGPTLCLVAATHGDELNGIEIVQRIIRNTDPFEISGTIIGVPIVNIFGFTNGSRYLPDRRDLNRYFPGDANGSSASRIAYRFFNQVVKHCDLLVDFHTGSFKRNNLPQLRADMSNPHVREFVRHFGSTVVLHKTGHTGNLRSAATRAGIAAVTFELGQPGSLQEEHIKSGVKAIETLLGKLGMIKKFHLWFEPQPVYYNSRWVRANSGGILNAKIKIGSKVKKNDLLGLIINPLTTDQTELRSPVDGRVLGMALNQFMLPGYAAFHIGISSDTRSMVNNPKETNDINNFKADETILNNLFEKD